MPIEEDKKIKKTSKKWKFLLILLLMIIIGGVFSKFFMQIKHIQSGYIGVKSSIGNPLDNTTDYDLKIIKGYAIFVPLYTEITTYPTYIQTAAYDSIKINTLDGTEFIVKPRISYQVDETKILLLYKNSKQSLSEINKNYLKEIIAYTYSNAASSFSADSLITDRNSFESLVNKTLSSKMSEIGLILKNTNSNLQIPQSIQEVIALRNQTLQNTIIAEDKKRQSEAEGEILLTKAKIRSKEDSLENSAITPLAIQKMFIEKWDGKLPIYGDTPKIYKSITE